MAKANPDAVDVRKLAKAVLELGHEGHRAEALAQADALAVEHPGSATALRVAGDLHFVAAIRARRAAADSSKPEEERAVAEAAAEAHLCSARDALSAAKLLVPDCVDIAAALGHAFGESCRFHEAEIEYLRALGISLPVDPAKHNAAYGVYRPETNTVNERVQEARDRVQLAYDSLKRHLIALVVERVLSNRKIRGPAESVQEAKLVAEQYPHSARALLLHGYMDLEFALSLDVAIDKRLFLGRTLRIVDRAAETFPNSVVIASFRAKLLFILGDHDAAERECRRALGLVNPHDPGEDCIPPGSISGPNRGARLASHSMVFHELLENIIRSARDYWEQSMTKKRRRDFQWVRLDVLEEYCKEVDQSPEFTIAGVQSFFKEHKSWRFWVCPICIGKKYLDTGSLLSHMCAKHPRAVLPSLQSIVDPNLTIKGDNSLECLTFCQDSEKRDIIRFKKRDVIFKWLFFAPSSGLRPKPFAQTREDKCCAGTVLLENIKKKLSALPADKSSTEFTEALPEIQGLWLNFVEASVLDYREAILALARLFLWRELKKCMAEDPKVSAKRISAADIDAIFPNVNVNEDPGISAVDPGISAVDEQTKENNHKSGDDQKTKLHKSPHSDQVIKINGNHQDSDLHAEDKSSGTMITTKLSDSPINMVENGNKLDEKEAKWQMCLHSGSSSEQIGVTGLNYQSSMANENSASDLLGTVL